MDGKTHVPYGQSYTPELHVRVLFGVGQHGRKMQKDRVKGTSLSSVLGSVSPSIVVLEKGHTTGKHDRLCVPIILE